MEKPLMVSTPRLRASLAVVALCGASQVLASPRPLAPEYVRTPDDSFRWKEVKAMALSGVRASFLHLTSQTWRGIPWEHWVTVLRPEKVVHPEHCLLIIAGGRKKDSPPDSPPREALLLGEVARRTGSAVAVINQVPFQPLFDGLNEDALISYTFEQFLRTQDETWPLLLPMAKSAIRAMDAVEEHLAKAYSQEVKKFVVTGASKRGWTTWLAGAMDPRVIGIAPMVIDTLHMEKQMPHQKYAWGAYSDEIRDYTERGLPERLGDPRSKRLVELVDPYSYRAVLTVPKLILIGTNDRYWPVDAIKHYFSDLPGEKYIHYVPNAGHGLGNGLSAVAAIGAFYQSLIDDAARPRFSWKLHEDGRAVVLEITAADRPEQVELWQASSPTRDFREATFSKTDVRADGERYRARVELPESGRLAFYAQLLYRNGSGQLWGLSTNMEVLSPEGVDFPKDPARAALERAK